VRHGERIALSNPKIVLWKVPHADHCGAISTAGKEFEARVLTWFDNHDHERGRHEFVVRSR
jgi:hypothetical protein